MKKSKLFISLTSLCFALAVLCFGVYAAGQVNYQISGNISYQVEDAFVEVNTRIYSLDEFSDGPTLTNTCFELGQKDFNTSSNFSAYDSVDISIPTYRSMEDNLNAGGLYDELDLTFNQDAKTFYIVINVKNLSSDVNVWAVMDYSASKFDIPEGVIQRDNAIQQWIGSHEGTKDNESIVIGLSVDDKTVGYTDETIKFGIKIGSGDYSQTPENLNKMEFSESDFDSSNGEYMLSYLAEDTSGIIVIPEYIIEDDTRHDINYIAGDESFAGVEFGIIRSIIVNAHLSFIEGLTFWEYHYLNSIIFNNEIDYICGSLDHPEYGYGYDILDEDNGLFGCGILDVGNYVLEYIYIKPYTGARYTTHTSNGNINLSAIMDTTNKILLAGSAGTDFEHLPSDLDMIGNHAFYGNWELLNFIIPDSVTSIGNNAFSGCTNIQNNVLNISNNITRIGISAFANCPIDSVIFEDNSSLEYLAGFAGTNITSIEIPDSVEIIGWSAFEGTQITEIEIPTSVKKFETNAFLNCTLLREINIPTSVVSIGNIAFSGCSSITTIYIPSSVITMSRGVFGGWTSEQTINIQHASKPAGWEGDWKGSYAIVNWGVSPA